MVQLLTIGLLLIVGFFLVAYFFKEKGGLVKDIFTMIQLLNFIGLKTKLIKKKN